MLSHARSSREYSLPLDIVLFINVLIYLSELLYWNVGSEIAQLPILSTPALKPGRHIIGGQ
jgi:hypothetical protein